MNVIGTAIHDALVLEPKVFGDARGFFMETYNRRALAQAKYQLSNSMRFVGQQCIQLHGGIGVTDECAASHYFKRLTMINATFGDVDHHLGLFSDTLLAA